MISYVVAYLIYLSGDLYFDREFLIIVEVSKVQESECLW